jgi:hypothetical protein
MPADSTLTRIAAAMDIALTSDQPAEVEEGVRVFIRLMRKTRLRGSDFVGAMNERDQALDLVKRYAARLDQLEAANKRLHEANGHGAGTLAQALWQDAGMPTTVEARHARWLMDLEAQDAIRLTEQEVDFLGSCSRRFRLSQAQQAWLADIVRKTMIRTGQAPPP